MPDNGATVSTTQKASINQRLQQAIATMPPLEKLQMMGVVAMCQEDYIRYCGQPATLSPASLACVEQHQHNLSARCDNYLATTIGKRLTRAASVRGVMLPNGSKLNYKTDGTGNAVVSSVDIPTPISQNGVTFAKGRIVLGNGFVQAGTLATDAVYQGISFKAGTPFILHSNKYIARGTLAKEVVIGGTSYAANGRPITFDEQGRIVQQ
jgi:hypothetical protein